MVHAVHQSRLPLLRCRLPDSCFPRNPAWDKSISTWDLEYLVGVYSDGSPGDWDEAFNSIMTSWSPLGNCRAIPNSYWAASESRTLEGGISRGSENENFTPRRGIVNFQESPARSRVSEVKLVTVPTASKNKEEVHMRTFSGGTSSFQRSK